MVAGCREIWPRFTCKGHGPYYEGVLVMDTDHEPQERKAYAALADPDLPRGLRETLENMQLHGYPLTLKGFVEWNWGEGMPLGAVVGDMWHEVPDMWHEEE